MGCICFSQKGAKVNDTPFRWFPALIRFMGSNRKLANNIILLKQPLAENSHETEQRRCGNRG
jgi:cell shape-determining protein MreC